MKNILVLCTGNSARSIMAECLFNALGKGSIEAWSAGSHPAGKPNPYALSTLEKYHIPLICGGGEQPASKSWDVFADDTAPRMDVVITVCDNAAGEVCPIWPANAHGITPQKLHWGFPDPADPAIEEQKRAAAFDAVFQAIRAQIENYITETKS